MHLNLKAIQSVSIGPFFFVFFSVFYFRLPAHASKTHSSYQVPAILKDYYSLPNRLLLSHSPRTSKLFLPHMLHLLYHFTLPVAPVS